MAKTHLNFLSNTVVRRINTTQQVAQRLSRCCKIQQQNAFSVPYADLKGVVERHGGGTGLNKARVGSGDRDARHRSRSSLISTSRGGDGHGDDVVAAQNSSFPRHSIHLFLTARRAWRFFVSIFQALQTI